MSERRRLLTGLGFATLGLAIALGTRPVATERILAAYILVLAATALAALVRTVAARQESRHPSAFEHALQRSPQRPMRPPELIRTEREITLGMSSAGHLYLRLLPLLREAAAARLLARRNVDLHARPDEARRLLGDETWELIRPDRPEPEDRLAPGIPLARLRAVVETLERV